MRGNAKFETMNKGFGLEIKGGTALETMPPDPGKDVAEDEKLDNKANGGAPKKGAIRTEEDDITMAKDVNLINEGSKRDVADGYTQDCVREGKGYKAYNEMVTKGIAADINLDSHNILKGLDAIEEHTSEITTKALGQRVSYAAHNIGQLGKQVAGMAKDKIVSGAGTVGRKVAAVPGAVGDQLGSLGSKAENVLRRANAKTTRMGASSGEGVLGRAASAVGRNRKATGAAIVGTGAAGVGGAAYGGKKLLDDSEEKCSKAPMKVKGVGSAAKKIYEGAKSKAGAAGKFIKENKEDLKLGGKLAAAGIGGAAVGAVTGGAAGGAIGAGKGKRGEGAKAGIKAQLEPFKHPIQSMYNPDKMGGAIGGYQAGRKLREED